MSEVLAFLPRNGDKIVWRCGCGCMSFTLREDGEAECAQCGDVVRGSNGGWRQRQPDPPLAVAEAEVNSVTVTDFNSSAAALRRMISKADANATAAVIVIQSDGGVTAWGHALETDEQSAWFDRRLAAAKEMLTR